jgi:hypothetical protein
MESAALRALYVRRFHLETFFSPAGVLGWLLGYPEKYRPLFFQARFFVLAGLCGCMALVKKIPFAGWLLRLVNALGNRMELLVGLSGGGSCFAVLKKHSHTAA